MTEQPDLKARVEELVGEWDVRCRLAAAGRADVIKVVPQDAEEILSVLILQRSTLQAAESRLALAEKVVEAGRVFATMGRMIQAWLPHAQNDAAFRSGAAWREKNGETRFLTYGDFRALSAALTAYAENTSSKDLTTGEDDA